MTQSATEFACDLRVMKRLTDSNLAQITSLRRAILSTYSTDLGDLEIKTDQTGFMVKLELLDFQGQALLTDALRPGGSYNEWSAKDHVKEEFFDARQWRSSLENGLSLAVKLALSCMLPCCAAWPASAYAGHSSH